MKRTLLLAVLLSLPAASEDTGASRWSGLPLADLVAVGSCAEVSAAVGALDDDTERLALAACQVRQTPSEVVGTLAGVTATSPVAPYAALLRAEALAATGRPDEALVALTGVTLDGDAAVDAVFVRARALLGLHRSLEARDALRALLTGPRADEARALLADGAEDRGDTEAALATWRKLWTESTRGPWATRAAERLAALGAKVPDPASADGVALIRARSVALSRDQQHGEALSLELMARAVAGPAEDAALGRLYFRAKTYPDAVRAWSAAWGDDGTRATDAASMFDLALARSRAGDYAGATTVYRALISRFSTSTQADEASFKLGFLPYDQGRCDEAVARFGEHIAARPTSTWTASARWFGGWCRWREGRVDDAVASWGALVAAEPGSVLAPAAAYWQARARGARGDAAGETALESVASRWPTTSYARFALARLGRAMPARPDATPPAMPATLAALPAAQRARVLLGAGLDAWALPSLRSLEPVADDTREGALALAWAYVDAGAIRDGQRLARRYCTDPWRGGDPVAMQACWPRPGRAIVDRVAARHGLPALLPYAIMQVESGLDPTVTSPAGARGAMQIMPALVGDLHTAAGVAGPADADRLWELSYAVALGTTELGQRWGTLGRTLAPDGTAAVIASYNGGEAATRRWIDALAAGSAVVEQDAFAEQVGFTETRRYVRSVLGQLQAWTWVYGPR